MEPIYVAKKSAWSVVSFWEVVFFWLIIPLIVMIIKIAIAKHETVEFYEDRIIEKSGILSKNENQKVFPSVQSVSVNQTFGGRLFNYGDVSVDFVGSVALSLEGIKKPQELKSFLQKRVSLKGVAQIMAN